MRRLLPLLAILLLTTCPRLAAAQTFGVEGVVRDAQTTIPVGGAAVALLDAATRDTLALDSTDVRGRYRLEAPASVDVEKGPAASDYHVAWSGPHPVTATSAPLVARYAAPSHHPGAPSLEVFDVQGRRVGTSAPLAAGVYLARLRFEGGYVSPAQRVVLLARRPLGVRLEREVPPRAQPRGAAGKGGALEVILAVQGDFYERYEATRSLEAGQTAEAVVALQPTAAPVAADSVVYDVTYRPETVVVEGAARAALVEADTAAGRFTFDAAALQASGTTLPPGAVMLVEGVALRRVESLAEEGDHLVVETAFASLEEAIADGEIAWAHELGFDEAYLPNVSVGGKAVPWDAQNKITLSYKAGDYEYKLEIQPTNKDTAEVKIEVTKDVGGLKARLTGLARLQKMKTSAAAQYQGGELKDFDLRSQSRELLIKIDLAAAGPGIELTDKSFRFPKPMLEYPILVGGIPLKVAIGAQIVFRLKVDANASATAQTTLRYDSDVGLEYKGTKVDVKNVTAQVSSDGSTTDAASTFLPVDLQYGFAVPRLEVSVLGVPLVPYIRTGFFMTSKLTWGPICKEGSWRVVLDGGLDLKIFKTEVNLLEVEFWKDETKKRSDGCPPPDGGKGGERPLVFVER